MSSHMEAFFVALSLCFSWLFNTKVYALSSTSQPFASYRPERFGKFAEAGWSLGHRHIAFI
jgi:hypothetical protein